MWDIRLYSSNLRSFVIKVSLLGIVVLTADGRDLSAVEGHNEDG